MILSKEQTKGLYRKTARFYDAALWFYRLMGVRRLRARAVDLLRIDHGDTVVDMGCGTGLNFSMLHEAAGSDGQIIGVDLTDAMLEKAGWRVKRAGWRNVELVEADLSTYRFPQEMNAALATFSMEMVPDYDFVIRRIAEALPNGGRLALLGLKVPEHWPEWLIRLAVWINKPFGASRDYASIRPWESVRRYFRKSEYREYYFGAAYMCVGEVQQR